MVDGLVDFEFGVGFQELEDSGFGIVAGAPWAIGEHLLWHVFNQRVKNHTIPPLAYEWRVGFQFL